MRKVVENEPRYWEFIRELKNDDLARRNSMSPHIVKPEEHQEYMKKYQDRYYICLLDGIPVGYIGTNAQDYVSIAVISEVRGKGLGKFMLLYFHKQMKDRKLRAIVDISNEASLRLFESCGFVKKYYIFEGDEND